MKASQGKDDKGARPFRTHKQKGQFGVLHVRKVAQIEKVNMSQSYSIVHENTLPFTVDVRNRE